MIHHPVSLEANLAFQIVFFSFVLMGIFNCCCFRIPRDLGIS